MKFTFILIIILILFSLPLLQIYLSLKEDKRIGLILPGITLALSIITPIVVNLFVTNISSILIMYVIIGCSTAMFYLVIYAICRSIVNKKKAASKNSGDKDTEINKMKIDDLG